jgi:hypothetical protein
MNHEAIKDTEPTLPKYGRMIQEEISYLQRLYDYWIIRNLEIADSIESPTG